MTDGILNVLKPPGMTSHDVVGYLRRILSTKKIGHAGTLDPDAAGVLPVFVGQATRLLEYAVDGTKSYRVEMQFGVRTDTGDDSGKAVAFSVVKPLTPATIQRTLTAFTGTIEQIPPMYSAIKQDGKKLYQMARAGIDVVRQPRRITIYKLTLIKQQADGLILDIECSKGTYIRTLVEDIAIHLGMCGTMSFLLRTQVAGFKLAEAKTLEEIAATPLAFLQPTEIGASNLPELMLTSNQAQRISQGVLTTVENVIDGVYRLKTTTAQFIGIGQATDGKVKAVKIICPFIPL
ncbi:MAG: tRNA pseudouridine(55) synthase TruB [Acidaminococcaceae bacterium]